MLACFDSTTRSTTGGFAYNHSMHWASTAQLLILITVANGAPVIARNIFSTRASQPLDFRTLWFDRRPLFGGSKTVRGVICSIGATIIAAAIIGRGWDIGLVVGGTAMIGDLLSSFVKRRLGLPPSARATGIDQIPESLLPSAICKRSFGLSWLEVFVITLVFFAGEIMLSRLLYRFHIRNRPY